MSEGSHAPETETVLPSLVLEWVSPENLGIDSDSGTVPPLLYASLSTIGRAALRATEVRLVLTGDFVASVRERIPEGPFRDAYDTTRGDGIVAGKTMDREDGTIDVVLPAWMFVALDDSDDEADRAPLVLRTVAHEAQHVAMDQAGEAEGAGYSDEKRWARRNFLAMADQVVGEYRAEVALKRDVRTAASWNPVDILGRLRADLRRIALVDYQEHLDVRRLCQDASEQAHIAWKQLAYVAAAQRDDQGAFDDLSGDVVGDSLWQRMAASHWSRFTEVLAAVPPGSQRVDRATLEPRIGELATELQTWLVDFGFSWTDEDDAGNSTFRIVGWDLLEPTSI